MTDPWKLLQEAREWFEKVPYGEITLAAFVKQLDTALAAHDAEPERKCGTCRHRWVSLSDPFFIPARCEKHLFKVTEDWFCADWQRKEEA